MSTGWECPKCGKVFAPWMPSCDVCKPAVLPTKYHICEPMTDGRCHICRDPVQLPAPTTGTAPHA